MEFFLVLLSKNLSFAHGTAPGAYLFQLVVVMQLPKTPQSFFLAFAQRQAQYKKPTPTQELPTWGFLLRSLRSRTWRIGSTSLLDLSICSRMLGPYLPSKVASLLGPSSATSSQRQDWPQLFYGDHCVNCLGHLDRKEQLVFQPTTSKHPQLASPLY